MPVLPGGLPTLAKQESGFALTSACQDRAPTATPRGSSPCLVGRMQTRPPSWPSELEASGSAPEVWGHLLGGGRAEGSRWRHCVPE